MLRIGRNVASTLIMVDDDPVAPALTLSIFSFVRGIGNISSGKRTCFWPSHARLRVLRVVFKSVTMDSD